MENMTVDSLQCYHYQYLWVHTETNEQVLVWFHIPSISSQQLVDLMGVELQDVEVAHHEGPNKELVVGEDVDVLLVVREVLGRLQDLEQTDCHQGAVESVLGPSGVSVIYSKA